LKEEDGVIVSVECQNKSLSIVKMFTADRLICIFSIKLSPVLMYP